jgi:hypothetical protein
MNKNHDKLLKSLDVVECRIVLNGMVAEIPASNLFEADITSDNPDVICDKIDEICTRSAYRPKLPIKPTHIFCSGAGVRLITAQLKKLQLFHHVKEIIPGVKVPAISTSFGYVEIVPTVYLQDRAEAEADIISYYIVDMKDFTDQGIFRLDVRAPRGSRFEG